MALVIDIVKKQKNGAKFVLSAAMLGLEVEEFDTIANVWIKDGGPGFKMTGVPHRRVIGGEFLIDRMTVIKED